MVDSLRGRHRVETLEQLLQQLRDGRSLQTRPETLFVLTLRVLPHVLRLQLLVETLGQILHVLVHVLRLQQAEILGQILHVLLHVLRLQLPVETLGQVLHVMARVLRLQLPVETLGQILHVLVRVLRLHLLVETLGQILHVLVHVLRLPQLQAETLRLAIRLGTQYLSRRYHQVVLCCRQSQAARLCSQF